jgi:folate-dependent tRNA-U54 methylase TrmFO/GidA
MMRYECYSDSDDLDRKIEKCLVKKLYGWSDYPYGSAKPKLRTDSLEEAVQWLNSRYDKLYHYFREYTEYASHEIEYCERNAWSGAMSARIFDTYESKVLDLRWTKYPEEL